MATLSKKFLLGFGIDEEKADLICERHKEVLTEIIAERDKFKEEAEKLPDIQKKLEEYQKAESDPKNKTLQVKYDALKEEFEEYKNGITAKETKAKKEEAYKQILKEIGIPDKRIPAILKVSDIDSIELDTDGNVTNKDKLTESNKAEWADFIPTKQTKGAEVANPPANGGKVTKTKEEIRAISDPIARQKAMLENPSLFGLPEAEE